VIGKNRLALIGGPIIQIVLKVYLQKISLTQLMALTLQIIEDHLIEENVFHLPMVTLCL